MPPLAALASEHNAACDEQEAEEYRNRVAEPGKQRRRIGRWRKDSVYDACGLPGKCFHDIAARVDDRADAGRGRAEHRQPLLGGAEPRLGEMLGRTPGSVPGVVRGVEDEVGPVALVDYVARKDDLVAD